MLGCVFPNTDKHAQDITTSLQNIAWSRSNRYNVLRHGCCLGATANTAGPYLHPLTQRHADLVRLINESIRAAWAERTFYWGSLQIKYNTVSNPHVDKNNLGTSLLSLYADFEQGSSHMQDHSLQLTSAQKGKWLCLDGTRPHYSTSYQGNRYSIVAVQHSTTLTLPPTQLQALRDLGFELPLASGPLKLQGEIDVEVEVGVDVDGAEAGARRNGR